VLVTSDQVSYLETHGTPLGDPIKVKAALSVYLPGHFSTQPLYIGSIKTNIRRLEAASGVTGLLKALLILEKKIIPVNVHLT